MNWIYYNDDKTLKGLEGRYRIKEGELQIEFVGANHLWDWFVCIFLSFLKPREFYLLKFQPKWFKWARTFHRDKLIQLKYNNVKIKGLSMGGAIGECLAWIIYNWSGSITQITVETYGSPKACKNSNKYITIPAFVDYTIKRYYNKCDIIPFLPPWYKKTGRIILNKKMQFPWDAHAAYNWRFVE
jgi:hypothetical protein